MNSFREKSIAFITYSSVGFNNKITYVNRSIGELIDYVAVFFNRVYYVASEAPKDSNIYFNGKCIYQYSFNKKNIEIIKLYYLGFSGKLHRTFFMINNLIKLYNTIKRCNYLVLFLPSYSNVLVGILSIVKRKQYSVYIGSDWSETLFYRLPNKNSIYFSLFKVHLLYPYIERFIVKYANFCLTTGTNLYNNTFNINHNTYEVIPLINNPNIKNKYSTSNNIVKKILYVGNLSAAKGIPFLIRAISIIKQKGIPVSLTLVGNIQQSFNEIIEYEKLSKDIIITGYLSNPSDIFDLYKKSDIFIIPTLGEGFPRVIYEAQLSFLPVIATNIVSIRTNIGNSDSIILVPPRNPQAIAEAVDKVITDKKLYKKLILNGYNFALKKTTGSTSNQFVQLINKHFG